MYIGTIAQDAGGNKASSMVRLSGDVGSISTNIFTFAELNGGGSDLQPVQCSDGIVLEGTCTAGPTFNGNVIKARQVVSVITICSWRVYLTNTMIRAALL